MLTFGVGFNILLVWVKIKGGEHLSPRTGRPRVKNPNTIKYSISINAQLESKLKAYCDKNKVTKSQAIRDGLELLLGK